MTIPTRPLTVTINGRRHGPMDVPEGLMMIDVLHEMLGLTGSRLGCGIGICHACVVIRDRDDRTSEEVRTCVTGAGFFDGKRIRTIEGTAQTNERGEIVALSPVQQAFLISSASSAATARRVSSMPRRCWSSASSARRCRAKRSKRRWPQRWSRSISTVAALTKPGVQ